jgi:hypothetical protein
MPIIIAKNMPLYVNSILNPDWAKTKPKTMKLAMPWIINKLFRLMPLNASLGKKLHMPQNTIERNEKISQLSNFAMCLYYSN